MRTSRHIFAYFFLTLAVLANGILWLSVRDVRAQWSNVPPVPGLAGASMTGVGDMQFAYRVYYLMLQNLGSSGGENRSLKEYDYEALGRWFYLMDLLDSRSDVVPHLAAYYFSNVEDPEKLRPVVQYLRKIGNRIEGEKWRWLAQAVYLARYKMNDIPLATEMALELAASKNENLPAWARQMPAYIKSAIGEKQAAYDIMVETLKSTAYKLQPEEIYNTKYYICNEILDKNEASKNPLCEGVPN